MIYTYKYSLFTILAGVFIFEKDWTVHLFLLNTFETAFESIVCLFVCFQQLANDILKNSKVKVRNLWNIFVFFHYVLLLLYKIIEHIMHSSQSSTRVAKIIESSKRGWKKAVRCKKKWSESVKDVREMVCKIL